MQALKPSILPALPIDADAHDDEHYAYELMQEELEIQELRSKRQRIARPHFAAGMERH
jgi:hypothetical protein